MHMRLRLRYRDGAGVLALVCLVAGLAGCETTGPGLDSGETLFGRDAEEQPKRESWFNPRPTESAGGGGGLFDGGALFGGGGQERWTIRCFESQAPNHEALCRQLGMWMSRVQGLDGSEIRLDSSATGSVIYYGSYRKRAHNGELQFGNDFREDIALIRGLTVNRSRPFIYAMPELVDRPVEQTPTTWTVDQATGPYTLQIAVFYDTPTFNGRTRAANQYVASLRKEQYEAYVHHGDVESVVFIGNFDDDDIVQTPEGPQLGPRVQRLIARNPDEFQHVTENGHLRKYMNASGRMEPITSFLVKVPEKDELETLR